MKTATKKRTETLEDKQSIINGLVAGIEFQRGRPLSESTKEKIEALEYGLTKRLEGLVERCKHEEMDLKIAAMREVAALIKPV
jgi:hypothetical protein